MFVGPFQRRQRPAADAPPSESLDSVYIRGLPPLVAEPELAALFAPFGTVAFAKIMRAPASPASSPQGCSASGSVSRGFGFVAFSAPPGAAAASIAALNGRSVDDGGDLIDERETEGEEGDSPSQVKEQLKARPLPLPQAQPLPPPRSPEAVDHAAAAPAAAEEDGGGGGGGGSGGGAAAAARPPPLALPPAPAAAASASTSPSTAARARAVRGQGAAQGGARGAGA